MSKWYELEMANEGLFSKLKEKKKEKQAQIAAKYEPMFNEMKKHIFKNSAYNKTIKSIERDGKFYKNILGMKPLQKIYQAKYVNNNIENIIFGNYLERDLIFVSYNGIVSEGNFNMLKEYQGEYTKSIMEHHVRKNGDVRLKLLVRMEANDKLSNDSIEKFISLRDNGEEEKNKEATESFFFDEE